MHLFVPVRRDNDAGRVRYAPGKKKSRKIVAIIFLAYKFHLPVISLFAIKKKCTGKYYFPTFFLQDFHLVPSQSPIWIAIVYAKRPRTRRTETNTDMPQRVNQPEKFAQPFTSLASIWCAGWGVYVHVSCTCTHAWRCGNHKVRVMTLKFSLHLHTWLILCSGYGCQRDLNSRTPV